MAARRAAQLLIWQNLFLLKEILSTDGQSRIGQAEFFNLLPAGVTTGVPRQQQTAIWIPKRAALDIAPWVGTLHLGLPARLVQNVQSVIAPSIRDGSDANAPVGLLR
ncbi:MAG: hypothetical protein HKN47_07740 [Pirellulaceae bacterium]|nr:hypothetical protein [Pirellulaceae bacterium]